MNINDLSDSEFPFDLFPFLFTSTKNNSNTIDDNGSKNITKSGIIV